MNDTKLYPYPLENTQGNREQNCNDTIKYAVDLEHFMADYYGLAYLPVQEDIGGAENGIRITAQSVLYHKTESLMEELQGIVDENNDQSGQAQEFIDRLTALEKQIVDTRPEVFPVSFDTFPACDLSGAEYVLTSGEKLRHCVYEPDFFMSENRLADGKLTTPHIYEAVWDNEGLPTSFRLTDNVQIISKPIPARMEESVFRTAAKQLLPGGAPEAIATWIQFAKENVDSEQYVDLVEEPENVATERWLNRLYSGLKAVKEDFGEPIAEQVCNLSTIQSCLYPGEMCAAAQHLQNGHTPEDIRDMVSSSELDCSELFVPTRKDSFQPEQLYCITIESPYEAVGPEISIKQEGIPYGQIQQQTEPGYLLKDGTALLECERDAYGNYQGSAGTDGMYLKTGKLYAPVVDADGHIQAFRQLHNKMLRQRDEKSLETAEISIEQNYNQIDGVINNEPPRSNQGYVILESEIIGSTEVVLAENKNAPQPFVTWKRNIENDELDGGGENFFWGHYMVSEEHAREDFGSRVKALRDDVLDAHPSICAQLKKNAASCEKQSFAPIQKKDTQER